MSHHTAVRAGVEGLARGWRLRCQNLALTPPSSSSSSLRPYDLTSTGRDASFLCSNQKGTYRHVMNMSNNSNALSRPARRTYATHTELPSDLADQGTPPPRLDSIARKGKFGANTANKPSRPKKESILDIPAEYKEEPFHEGDTIDAVNGQRWESEMSGIDPWDIELDTPSFGGVSEGDDLVGFDDMAFPIPSMHKSEKQEKPNEPTFKSRLRAKPPPKRSSKAGFSFKQKNRSTTEQSYLSISEQPFEDFRMQHRKDMYRLDYYRLPSPGDKIMPHQPHFDSLLSPYDWRLRTPWRTPGERQKLAYASKTIFRKRAKNGPELRSAELEAYQTKFTRFIDLERAEAERLALIRLQKQAHRSKRSDSRIETAADLAEHLTGMSGVLRRKRQRSDFVVDPQNGAEEHGSNIDPLDPSDMRFDQDGTKERKLIYFARPGRPELPRNAFRRGQVIFIWKCQFDDFTKEWYVPELLDTSLDLNDLKRVPARGWVHREWSNQIDVMGEEFDLDPEATYRLDIGYDGTAFDRQAAALEKLAYDAAEQRRSNDQTSRGPHLPSRGIEISGTELRHFILDTEANDSRDSQIGDISSPVFSQDQFIVSWAKRYSRHVPLRLEGDPDLGLNVTQTRAVAQAIRSGFSLIQGPPGTGKTATIVAALKLLKSHFQIAAPVLVCAHTNVVVDMIVDKCAEEGIRPLRFGREQRIREDLKEWSLEEQIKIHALQPTLRHWSNEEDRLLSNQKEIRDRLSGKHVVFNDLGTEGASMSAQERSELETELESISAGIQRARMIYVMTLKKIHSDLIASADVCLATCSSASSWEMSTADFPIVFIDEAAQCDEPTSLIPLMKGCRHVVLIGDHKQLPSVCISDQVRHENLNRSLFERLKLARAVPSIQLDTQYRMLPTISAFPNQYFYNRSIRDSPERQAAAVSIGASKCVTFYDHDSLESRVGQSLANEGEANQIIELLLQYIQHSPPQTIGVISMYAAQADLLRVKARAALGEDHGIEIHTVDAFQGRDKDTIVISTVRSNATGTIGFLKDPRRLNVALTRARNRLYVYGNTDTLSRVSPWDREESLPSQYVKWLQQKRLIRS